MIKLYICCLILIIESVEVGPDIDMKFHQEVMEIVTYDIGLDNFLHFDQATLPLLFLRALNSVTSTGICL